MADLEAKTIAATYRSLLNVGTANNQELDATPRVIADGAGNASALYLATDEVLINSTNNLTFNATGSGEYIYGDGTDLRVYSGADILLVPTGNVGIGEAVPAQKLVVADASSPNILIQRYTNASQGAVDDEVLGRLQFGAQDSTGSNVQPGVGAHIYAEATGLWDNDDVDDCPTKLVFGTSNNGATSSGIMGPGSGISGHSVIDRMTILADGKIGIGTDTPAVLLDIEDHTASSASQGGNLRLASDDGAVMASGHRLGVIEFAGAESAESEGGARDGTITVGARIEAVTDATWSTSENGADLVIYTTDGNASQAENMRIYSDSTSGVQIQNTTTSSATEGGKLRLTCDDGAVMVADHRLGVIEFGGAEDTNNTITVGAKIEAVAMETWDASNNGATLDFYTTEGNNDAAQRMTILADGKVGIGTPSPGANLHINGTGLSTTATSALKVTGTGNSVENEAWIGVIYENSSDTNAPTGFARLDASDGAANYIFASNNDLLCITTNSEHIGLQASATIVGTQSSDERLKDISTDAFPYGLSEINKLTPIQFKYKKDKNQVSHIGFGAQTTKPIIPESVRTTGMCPDGYDKETRNPKSNETNKLDMEYVQIIPVLVKAIQELSAKVEALENA